MTITIVKIFALLNYRSRISGSISTISDNNFLTVKDPSVLIRHFADFARQHASFHVDNIDERGLLEREMQCVGDALLMRANENLDPTRLAIQIAKFFPEPTNWNDQDGWRRAAFLRGAAEAMLRVNRDDSAVAFADLQAGLGKLEWFKSRDDFKSKSHIQIASRNYVKILGNGQTRDFAASHADIEKIVDTIHYEPSAVEKYADTFEDLGRFISRKAEDHNQSLMVLHCTACAALNLRKVEVAKEKLDQAWKFVDGRSDIRKERLAYMSALSGEIDFREGRLEKALVHFRRSKSYLPINDPNLHVMIYLRLAAISQALGHPGDDVLLCTAFAEWDLKLATFRHCILGSLQAQQEIASIRAAVQTDDRDPKSLTSFYP